MQNSKGLQILDQFDLLVHMQNSKGLQIDRFTNILNFMDVSSPDIVTSYSINLKLTNTVQ